MPPARRKNLKELFSPTRRPEHPKVQERCLRQGVGGCLHWPQAISHSDPVERKGNQSEQVVKRSAIAHQVHCDPERRREPERVEEKHLIAQLTTAVATCHPP